MPDTTHSSNYQIKQTGTGREASTWGNSNNENFSRLEAAIGRVVSLNVTAMPISSTSATAGNSWTAEWITVNASDSESREAGSEGRCQFVEFTGVVTGNVTVNIRGATTGVIPARVLFVKNSLTGVYTLTLNAGGTNYTLADNASACVAVVPSVTGGFAQGVHEVFGALNGLQVATSKRIEFLGAGEIRVPVSTASAIKISDGATDFLVVDNLSTTTSLTNNIFDLNASIMDLSTQGTTFRMIAGAGVALAFTENGGSTFLAFNTSSNEIDLPIPLNITSANIYADTQDMIMNIRPNRSGSIVLTDGVANMFTMATTTGALKITFHQNIHLDVGKYINWGATTGTTGYGIRENSGVIEHKHSGGAWAKIAKGVVVAAASAATVTNGQDKQGVIDLGPIRIIFNTITATGTGVAKVVTLGTGDGTASTMASALWTVMAVQADGTTPDANVSVHVLNSAAGTFNVYGVNNTEVTYWAIGDSAA